jgi:hypothetical protein
MAQGSLIMKEKNAASVITVLRCIGVVIAVGAIAVSDVGYGSSLIPFRDFPSILQANPV